jgi:hypothetical protein
MNLIVIHMCPEDGGNIFSLSVTSFLHDDMASYLKRQQCSYFVLDVRVSQQRQSYSTPKTEAVRSSKGDVELLAA